MEIEQRRVRLHRTGEPEGRAGDQPHPHAAIVADRELRDLVMLEARFALLVGLGQRHPALDHFEGSPGQRRRIVEALRMGDSAPTSHPRSEERRVGKACARTFSYRASPRHNNHKLEKTSYRVQLTSQCNTYKTKNSKIS